MKQCSKCKEVKSLDEYYSDKQKRDGLYSSCKICLKKRNFPPLRSKKKTCLKCKEEKLGTEFSRARSRSDGLQVYCTTCRLQMDRERKYGCTSETYEEFLERQDSLCAICGKKPDKEFHVDHDHKTGKIRGLLCDTCNRGIGYFKDDSNILRAAARYLDGS